MKNDQYIGTVVAEIIEHRGQKRIALQFDFDSKVMHIVRNLPNRRYSKTKKRWHLPNTAESQKALRNCGLRIVWRKSEASNKKNKNVYALSSKWKDKLDTFQNYLIRQRYSDSTVKSYRQALVKLFVWLDENQILDIDLPGIHKFNDEVLIKGSLSRSYQNVLISALKLFLEKFTEYNIDLEQLERPRRSRFLPRILSEQDVKDLIDSFYNLKHKAIIMVIYSCGLRKSELLNLKLSDIDSRRMVMRIRNSKGAKDRDIALPRPLLKLLRTYYKRHQPKVYLFEGYDNRKYSPSSVDKVLKAGLRKIGKPGRITAHGLRHSYATHLVERNINLRYIQEAMGHRSSKTTEIYTKLSKEHIANMVSPIDFWKKEDENNEE